MILLSLAMTACTPKLDVGLDDTAGATVDTHEADTDTDTDTDTDSDTDSDTDTDNPWGHHPGEAGALGLVVLTDALWSYSILGYPEEEATAWWSLVEPEDTHVWDYYAPADDTCELDFEGGPTPSPHTPSTPPPPPPRAHPPPPTPPSPLTDLSTPAHTRFETPARTIEMELYGHSSWSNEAVDPAEVKTGHTYDLPEVSSGVVPDFSIEGAVVIPEALTLDAPDLDLGAEFLRKSELTFQWSGAHGADRVALALSKFDTTTWSYEETVSCVALNDGHFQVPAGAFSDWEFGDYVVVSLMAMQESGTVLDFNGSDFRVVGAHELLGVFISDD